MCERISISHHLNFSFKFHQIKWIYPFFAMRHNCRCVFPNQYKYIHIVLKRISQGYSPAIQFKMKMPQNIFPSKVIYSHIYFTGYHILANCALASLHSLWIYELYSILIYPSSTSTTISFWICCDRLESFDADQGFQWVGLFSDIHLKSRCTVSNLQFRMRWWNFNHTRMIWETSGNLINSLKLRKRPTWVETSDES